MKNKQKKFYTKGGYLGLVYFIHNGTLIVQPTDGSKTIKCKGKNLSKANWEGKEPVAFDYFCEEGNIVIKCFPMSRAASPVEGHVEVTKADKENVRKHVDFVGTLDELRELVAAEEKTKADAEVKTSAVEKVETPAPTEALVEEPIHSDAEETLPEEEIPDDAAEWDEEEAEEYEEESSEFDEYDDDSYYDFDDKPSSKGEWR